MPRAVIVGAGIIGTFHAWIAINKGWDVVQIERDPAPQGASVRNFGLIWISGRAQGEELNAALRARQVWSEVGDTVEGVGFRANGSVTIATGPAEAAVLEEAVKLPDADAREFSLMSPAETRRRNPAIAGDFELALFCGKDAAVEPRRAVHELRRHLEGKRQYRFVPNTEAHQIVGNVVIGHNGVKSSGDVIILCPGADHRGVAAQWLDGAPLRRVFLQMMETDPFNVLVTTAIADADSLRYYPAFQVPALRDLPHQDELAAQHRLQLLMQQRFDGGLTIGDTHLYEEPFPFDVEEAPYLELARRAEAVLGRKLPPIRGRWSGVYSQLVGEGICYRAQVESHIWVVTGPGGRGNTLAPAIAADTWEAIG